MGVKGPPRGGGTPPSVTLADHRSSKTKGSKSEKTKKGKVSTAKLAKQARAAAKGKSQKTQAKDTWVSAKPTANKAAEGGRPTKGLKEPKSGTVADQAKKNTEAEQGRNQMNSSVENAAKEMAGRKKENTATGDLKRALKDTTLGVGKEAARSSLKAASQETGLQASGGDESSHMLGVSGEKQLAASEDGQQTLKASGKMSLAEADHTHGYQADLSGASAHMGDRLQVGPQGEMAVQYEDAKTGTKAEAGAKGGVTGTVEHEEAGSIGLDGAHFKGKQKAEVEAGVEGGAAVQTESVDGWVKAHAKARAGGEASEELHVDAEGAKGHVGGKLSAEAEVAAEGGVKAGKVEIGGHRHDAVAADGKVRGALEAYVGGDADGSIGPDGAKGSLEGGAGAMATADAKGKVELLGGVFKVGGEAGIGYGAAAKGKVSGSATFKEIGFSAKQSLGVGFAEKLGISASFSPEAAVNLTMDIGSELASGNIAGALSKAGKTVTSTVKGVANAVAKAPEMAKKGIQQLTQQFSGKSKKKSEAPAT